VDTRSVAIGPGSVDAVVDGEDEEYAHLVPVQWRYAALAVDDPQRPRLRERLISGYLPVAEHIASRFGGRGQPVEDLIQVATVGLIHAVDRFEPARGSHFLAFAVPTITGEIRRYFRDHGWSTRVPRRLKDLHLAIRSAQAELAQQHGRPARPSEIAHRLAVPTAEVIEALHAAQAYRSSSLDELLSYADTPTTAPTFGQLDTRLALIDDREALRALLAELAPRQRTILALRFVHELTQSQIAAHVGLSQMHVSRVLRQTLATLHQRMTDPEQQPDPQRSTNGAKRAACSRGANPPGRQCSVAGA
jgi:RNA polymerase sigma-B factor